MAALEEDVAKRLAEVHELKVVMKTLSKRLHNAATGPAKLPKSEHRSLHAGTLALVGAGNIHR